MRFGLSELSALAIRKTAICPLVMLLCVTMLQSGSLGAADFTSKSTSLAQIEGALFRFQQFWSCKRCPSYELIVLADGTVCYQGRREVMTIGGATWKIPEEDVRRLTSEFDKSGFENFKDSYIQDGLNDMPIIELVMKVPAGEKIVRFHYSRGGAPSELVALGKRFAHITGVKHKVCPLKVDLYQVCAE